MQTRCLNCGLESCECVPINNFHKSKRWRLNPCHAEGLTFALLALALIALDLMNIYESISR